MTRFHGKPEPHEPPLNENDIHGALRVIHSLEKLAERPQVLTELLPGNARTTSLARHLLACRVERAEEFGPDLFAEPAWDILLTLYIAEKEGYRLKVSAVCNESGVADTTALRWIERLVELGLVHRRQNPMDRRSSFVEVTSDGVKKMERVLEKAWHKHFPVD